MPQFKGQHSCCPDCLNAERQGISKSSKLALQTLIITNQEVIGPQNPDFRVEPGALREAVSSLEVLLYEESIEPTSEDGQVASARVVAKNS